MPYIITPEDEILINALITALSQQTETLPPSTAEQIQALGQVPPAQINDSIQTFLEDLDYQPLLDRVNQIEKQLLRTDRQRGKGSPPTKVSLEHSAEIFNTFTQVVTNEDIKQAAQAALTKIGRKP